MIAAEALANAIIGLDPTGSMLTSTHYQLVKLAYETECIQPALQVLDKTIVYYPGMTGIAEPRYPCDMSLPPPAYISKFTGFTSLLKSQDVLEYDLLCGLMYSSLKYWDKAFAAFQRVITYPTRDSGVSKIMAEAYKKWVLVGLLLDGKNPSFPPYASNNANKVYTTLAKPYTEIARLFGTTNAEQLKAEAEKHELTWQEDSNVGFIREVLAAYQKWQIIRLADVYSKISISEIRSQTNSGETGTTLETDQEVEELVRSMIQTNMLRGALEPAEGSRPTCLAFLPPADQLSEAEFAQAIATSLQRIQSLQAIFKSTNERLATSKDYVKHVIKEQKRQREGDGRDPGLGFDAQIEDEDLMTGILQHT
jgi:COP9 signalosome complex subunit 3